MRSYKIFFPITFILLMFENAILLNYLGWLGLISAVVVGIHLTFVRHLASKFEFKCFASISIIYLMLLLSWNIFDTLPLWIATAIFNVILILFSFVFIIRNRKQEAVWWEKGLRLLGYAVLVALLVGSCYLMYYTVRPDAFIGRIQGVNSYEPQKVQSPEFDTQKYTHISDVEYASQYPNSFLDIITINDGEVHPVFSTYMVEASLVEIRC